MKVLKVEEYFVYFPLLIPHSWEKDPLFSRRRLIQSFPKYFMHDKGKNVHTKGGDVL